VGVNVWYLAGARSFCLLQKSRPAVSVNVWYLAGARSFCLLQKSRPALSIKLWYLAGARSFCLLQKSRPAVSVKVWYLSGARSFCLLQKYRPAVSVKVWYLSGARSFCLLQKSRPAVSVNVWYLAGARSFCLLQKSRPAVGPIQSHILWVPRVLFAWIIGRCLKLITHLQLVLKLRMSGAILSLSQCTFVACTSYIKVLWKPNATHEVAWVFQIFQSSEDTCFEDSAKMMIVRRKFPGETGISYFRFNLLKPNDVYICRTAALTSRSYILNIYSTNIHTEYFKHAA